MIEGMDPRVRMAALELELHDCEAQIRSLREEYRQLRVQMENEQAGAAVAGINILAQRLAPLFSQLATMQVVVEQGRSVRSEDLLKLFGKVEDVLAEVGLARIGSVGEAVAFDTQLHQRMSGEDVDDKDPVTIRFVGYRLGETALLRARVSRRDGEA
jgi:molecular chaperone GrpE (heat shock protein)